jgi:hypothetical protein
LVAVPFKGRIGRGFGCIVIWAWFMFSFISKCIFIVYSSIPTVNYVYWFPKITVTCLNSQIYKYSVLVFIQKKRIRWIYGDVCVYYIFSCVCLWCVFMYLYLGLCPWFVCHISFFTWLLIGFFLSLASLKMIELLTTQHWDTAWRCFIVFCS